MLSTLVILTLILEERIGERVAAVTLSQLRDRINISHISILCQFILSVIKELRLTVFLLVIHTESRWVLRGLIIASLICGKFKRTAM